MNMKQIRLNEASANSLVGKVIKDISYLPWSTDTGNPQLIITFTDDTYIFLTSQEDSESGLIQFENDYIAPLSCYANAPGYVDSTGKFHYYKVLEEQIRLGLLEANRELEKKRLKEEELRKNEAEYKEYLRLKEKYGRKE